MNSPNATVGDAALSFMLTFTRFSGALTSWWTGKGLRTGNLVRRSTCAKSGSGTWIGPGPR